MEMKSKDMYPPIFSRHAAGYERLLEEIMSRGEALGRRRAVELIDVQPGMRVLDLACGPGTLTRRLAAAVATQGEVVGVDLAAGMIQRATELGIPNVRFEIMDIEQLAYPDASFDAAICGHGLQFVPHLDRALAEARRVLHAGSRFAASIPVSAPDPSAVKLLDTVVDRWLPPAPRAVDQSATQSLIGDRYALGEAALAAGFATARVEVIDEPVMWESAEQIVSHFASWWDCAMRLDTVESSRRRGFIEDAVASVRREYPGPIETTTRNHVLFATA